MGKLKVLMLGPEKPGPESSGLGVAALQIANHLADKVELTLVRPGEEVVTVEEVTEMITSHSVKTTEWAVSRDIILQNITHSVSPYYSSETIEEVKSTDHSVVRESLSEYTTEVVNQSRELTFDLIYAHDWVSIPAAIQIKKRTNKPLVIHFHSLDYDRMAGKDRSWVFDLEKEALEMADAVITVSNYSLKVLQDHYHVDPNLIYPIYNGVDAYERVDHLKMVNEDIILFVGRLSEQKGPGIFLEIAEEVHSKNPNTRFVMVGKGEKQKEILESGAYQSIAHKFHLTGFVEQKRLQEFYSISSIYCMPSVSEPFGLTAMEAATVGIPMVISKQSGAAEILEGALTADHWNTHEFADHILKLLGDDEACRAMIEKNRKALQSISWTNTTEQIMGVFHKITSKQGDEK